jgi:catechol 2,3-dioxygenase-like lactoylglutathione lyase family enzyme
MIQGIHHTAISTGDLERALRFYRDLLGFEEVFSSAWEVGSEDVDRIVGLKDSSARVVMLKAGNACVELFQYETPRPKPGEARRPVCDHGITHLCLQVTDIDAEYERLKAAGMLFHCPPQSTSGLRVTYGRDPDGNVVELLEVTDRESTLAVQTR